MLMWIWVGTIVSAAFLALALGAFVEWQTRRLQRKYPGWTPYPQPRPFYVRVIPTIER